MLHNLKSKPSMVDAAVAYCILYKIQNTEGQQAGKQYVPAPCCKPSQAAPPIHAGWKPVYCHSSQPGESDLQNTQICFVLPKPNLQDTGGCCPVSAVLPAPHLRPTAHPPGLALPERCRRLENAWPMGAVAALSFGVHPDHHMGLYCT